METGFYLYAFWDEGGSLAYIGKGFGKRFQDQKRRMARKGYTYGEIWEWVENEQEAYRRERELIAELHPYANRNKGGAGGFSRNAQLRARLREIQDLRSRMKPFWRWIVENPERAKIAHHYRSSRRPLWRMESQVKRELSNAGSI